MRVLLVWRGPANRGERWVLSRRQVPLLRQLVGQGVRPVVVLLGDAGGMRSDLEAAAIEVYVLPTPLPPPASATWALPMAVFRLRRLIRRLNPDIVEGEEAMTAVALGLARLPRRQGVLVYRQHDHGGRLRLLLASRLAARLADRTFVSCEAMRRFAAERDRTPLRRIDVATSGAADMPPSEPCAVAAARAALGIPEGALVVVAVSRLRWEKGIDVLVRAFARLEGIGNVHLVIVGTGPEEASLRLLAKRCPLPVHFVGERDDVHVWFALADMVAMPSRREHLGRTAIESMAAGRPLVASRVGGLGEAVIDGETGLLVPPDGVDEFAAALRSLLGDRARALRMGRAARARFEARYTIGHMATAWREAWQRALVGAEPVPR